MSSMIKLAILIICMLLMLYSKLKQWKGDSRNGLIFQMKSTELLWSINEAPTILRTNINLKSGTIWFAEHEWFLELQWENECVTMDLKTKKPFSDVTSPGIYLGIGVIRADLGENLYGWFETEMKKEVCLDSIRMGRWTGPRLHNLLQNTETWMPGGVLTFFVRLSMYPAPFVIVQKDSYVLGTLSQNLKNLFLNDKECDVTIKVKEESFRAHRLILKAHAPVLAAMFSHNMLESETREIRVDDCDPKAFGVFLLFLYSGAVDDLAIDNVIPLYYIADKYDLPDLKDECCRYMWSTLTIHSVSNVIALAKRHDESVLLDKATEFFLWNAEEIFLTDEWQRFMRDNPTQANELVIKAVNLYAKEKNVGQSVIFGSDYPKMKLH